MILCNSIREQALYICISMLLLIESELITGSLSILIEAWICVLVLNMASAVASICYTCLRALLTACALRSATELRGGSGLPRFLLLTYDSPIKAVRASNECADE